MSCGNDQRRFLFCFLPVCGGGGADVKSQCRKVRKGWETILAHLLILLDGWWQWWALSGHLSAAEDGCCMQGHTGVLRHFCLRGGGKMFCAARMHLQTVCVLCFISFLLSCAQLWILEGCEISPFASFLHPWALPKLHWAESIVACGAKVTQKLH